MLAALTGGYSMGQLGRHVKALHLIPFQAAAALLEGP